MSSGAALWRFCLILILPIAGTLLVFSLPPELLGDLQHLSLAWIAFMTALGGYGVLLLPLRPVWKVAALLLYVPSQFVVLFLLAFMTACFNDLRACP